jgi:hypothetical protein
MAKLFYFWQTVSKNVKWQIWLQQGLWSQNNFIDIDEVAF